MRLKPLFVALCLLLSATAAQAAFKFTAWADNRPYDPANRARFRWTIEEMDRILGSEPQFHIVPGDYDLTNQTRDDLNQYALVSSWARAPGNHDTEDLGMDHTSWDEGNAHFIFINEYHCGDGRICEHVYNWLEADLNANTQPAVFVVGHEPAFPENRHVGDSLDAYPQERDAFWRLLNDRGVLAYICGHTHVYSTYSDETGPTVQIDAGNAGNPSIDGNPLTFVAFDVQDQAVEVYVYSGLENEPFTGGSSFSMPIPQPVLKARNPVPADGLASVATDTTLRWTPGAGATGHDLSLWPEGGSATLVSLPDTTTSYTPALEYGTHYFWRVDEKYADASVVTGTVWNFTTRPATTISYAAGEITYDGVVSGAGNTDDSDNQYESLTEVLNVPNKNGYSTLDHVWTFNVTPGTNIEFQIEAWHTPSNDGDDFALAYSTDGASYQNMLTVSKTQDDNGTQTFTLPSTLSGTVYVRATDTDHTKKNQAFDTLYVDALCIVSSEIDIPQPPTYEPPSAVAGADVTVAEGEIVTLDASVSSDPDGTIEAYEWDVDGAGYTLSGAQVTLTLSPGTHLVTLRVTDDDGLTAYDDVQVTVVSASASVHVADLDAAVNLRGSSGRWDALVTVTVVDQGGVPVFGATVTGDWSGATSGSNSGVTGSDGTVTFGTDTMKTGTEVTFTVTGVSYATLPYDSSQNSDTDGDSDGTAITATIY